MTKRHREDIEAEKPTVETARSSPSVITISKETVDAAKPRGARYILWDTRLKGFGVRIEPSGAKSFVVRYREVAFGIEFGAKGAPEATST
jgi:hypothetical protein